MLCGTYLIYDFQILLQLVSRTGADRYLALGVKEDPDRGSDLIGGDEGRTEVVFGSENRVVERLDSLVHDFDREHLEASVKARAATRRLVLQAIDDDARIELEGVRLPGNHVSDVVHTLVIHGHTDHDD